MIKRNLDRIKKLINEFGFLFTVKLYFLYAFSRNKLYIKYLLRMLEKENYDLIEKYNSLKKIKNDKNSKKNYIWFFWWQGKDNMPIVPQMCYKTLIKNKPQNYEVIFIDKNNYAEYAKMPEYIMKKLEEKKFTLTHFSDLLRQELLCEHGGFWIDSTVFCPNELDNYNFEQYKFWSVKLPFEKISKKSYGQNISKGMYSGFLLKSDVDSFLMNFLKECNFNYWNNHEFLIDYFIQILLIRLAYEKIPVVKKEVDDIEINNTNLYELDKIMNKKFDKELFDMLINDNYFFKLSWKKNYLKEIDGEKTFYGYLIENYLESEDNNE